MKSRPAYVAKGNLSAINRERCVIDCLRRIEKTTSSHFRIPSAIATVAIGNSSREACVLLLLLEKFAPEVPVYVYCDPESAWRFEAFKNAIVRPQATAEAQRRLGEELKDVPGSNHVHINAAIHWKFTALREAVQSHGDALFLDADFIPLAPVTVPTDCQMAFSPHYNDTDNGRSRYSYSGVFNVGMVWTRDLEFIRRWEWMWLNDTIFLEQEPLNWIAQERPNDIRYWGPQDNHGHWRQELPDPATVRSCHAHLTKEHLGRADPNLQQHSWNLASRILSILRSRDQVLHWRVCKVLDIPTRMVYAHIPKTGGVTVTQTLRRHVFDVYHDGYKDEKGHWVELPEAKKILSSPESPGVFEMAHKHHFMWTREELELAIEHGWRTASFIRNPFDLLCSMYHYFKRDLANGKPHPYPPWEGNKQHGRSDMSMAIGTFFWAALRETGLRQTWELPEWFDDLIELKMPFSPSSLQIWIRQTWFIDIGEPQRLNASANQGFQYYLDNGFFAEKVKGYMRSHAKLLEYARYVPVELP